MYRILTVAREDESGGDRIAALVAKRLGWKLLDSALIEEIAHLAHVDPQLAREFDERVDSWMHRISRRGLWHGAFDAVAVLPEDRSLRRRNHGPVGTRGHRTRLGNRQLCHRGARQPVHPAEPPGRLSCFPLCALRRPRGERPPAHGPRGGCPRMDSRGRCGARALRANEFWPGMAGPPSLRSDDPPEGGGRAGGLDNF